MQSTAHVSQSRSERQKPKSKSNGGGDAKTSIVIARIDMFFSAVIVALYISLRVNSSALT
jgi:hypothetical protein